MLEMNSKYEMYKNSGFWCFQLPDFGKFGKEHDKNCQISV
jgi:hypothetical protein